MKNKLIVIARHLTDQRESKKHGGWEVYEDDKIKIMYDTYYPNVDVYVKIGGKLKLVALYSGHGYTQEYHPGAWEKYVTETLYPDALLKKEEAEKKEQKRKEELRNQRFDRIDDSAVFG